ncbi:hypothetical protein T01_7454 [Trichinella spiralis]|uniref:Transmembrane protein n=1 Tax=Trichinella spiralis TaxID=6334 RepID=A0A0V1BJP5_TRISP|nr:hypothetical protein T01_7454 [Trichinella spiralis]
MDFLCWRNKLTTVRRNKPGLLHCLGNPLAFALDKCQQIGSLLVVIRRGGHLWLLPLLLLVVVLVVVVRLLSLGFFIGNRCRFRMGVGVGIGSWGGAII